MRAALVALGGLWIQDGVRSRPVPLGPQAHWQLTDGNINEPEAVTGTRAQIAARIGHVMAPKLTPPAWDLVLSALLIDPDAPVP